MRMFDHLSKLVASDREAGGRIGDLSGAFADLGTFLPLVIGLLVVGQFDPTGLLVGFGLFAVLTGLIYRLPIPVQPMKAVAALAIAGGLTAPALAASGFILGLALVILGSSGLVDKMHRMVPRTVLIGIQLGLGLHLVIASVELAAESIALALGACALLLVLQATALRTVACLIMVALGIAWSLSSGSSAVPGLALAWHWPQIALPNWSAMQAAAGTVVLPQLALTIANAVLLTSVLVGEYFPKTSERASAKRLALSSGALNLALAPIGAMPMCHGAGGLVAQYQQGARSGLAPVVFGLTCLGLGLFAGPEALAWLSLIPLPVVAAILAFAGLQLMNPKRLMRVSPVCIAVIALTAACAVLVNIAAGLAAGLIAELLRSACLKTFRRSA
jgi:SulP family sulfate permease